MIKTVSMSNWPQGWVAACRSADVTSKPYSTTIYGVSIVLFRSQEGTVSAIEDRCLHRMVPLSKGRVCDGLVECPYHGWRYDGEGRCRAIPGLAPEAASMHGDSLNRLTSARTIEVDGLIFVSYGSEISAHHNALASEQNRRIAVWRANSEGALADVAENILDGFHTHFVHAGLIRSDGVRKPVTARIRRSHDRCEIEYLGEGCQNGIISRLFERERTSSFSRFILPGIAELEYRSSKGTKLLITAYLTPSAGDAISIHAVIAVPGGPLLGRLKLAALTPFFKLALKQDKDIVHLQTDAIQRWDRQDYISTRLDVMRPHIEQLLTGQDKSESHLFDDVELFL